MESQSDRESLKHARERGIDARVASRRAMSKYDSRQFVVAARRDLIDG